jgi:hypothetical protein
MRHYIQLKDNLGVSEMEAERIPTSDTIIDVTGRVDGPWLGRLYDRERDLFIDKPPLVDPRPVAEVVLYDPRDLAKTLKLSWQINEEIGIDVAIKDGQGRVVTDFNGSFGIPIRPYDPNSRTFVPGGVRRLGLEFIAGIATRTFRGFSESGDYGVDERVSDLARVLEPLIISVTE